MTFGSIDYVQIYFDLRFENKCLWFFGTISELDK